MSHSLTLRAEGQGHRKNQQTMPQGTINMPSTKKMSRDSPSYWCPTNFHNNMNNNICLSADIADIL